MPIEKILIEFAKLQLQLIAANEQISALQAQINASQQSVKPELAQQQ
jgi:hypothetical protein